MSEKTTQRSTIMAYGLLILAQTMVGINIVSAKYLIAFMPILFIMTIRFILAAIISFGLHLATDRHRRCISRHTSGLDKKDWVFILGQALTAGVLFNFLMIFGLHYTSANNAGIITSTLPAFIALMSWIFLKEKFGFKNSICVGLATLGLIVINSKGRADITSHAMLGNLLILFSMLPEASYYIFSKLRPNRLPIFLISAILNCLNAIIVLPLLLCSVDWSILQFTAFQGLILLLISLTSALFFIFWYLVSNRVDGMMASLSTAIMPIATVIIACLTLGETILSTQIVGICLVISSILAYALPQKEKPLQAYSSQE